MDIWAGAASAAANNTVEHRRTAKCKAGRFTPRLITYIIIAPEGERQYLDEACVSGFEVALIL
jgi:hypothetical protein